jgi:hypothetical protein
MNFLKLSILLIVLIAFSACKDDEPTITCTQSDWVGTYVGNQVCDGDTESVTVTITASGSDAIIIKYEVVSSGGSGEVEYDPLTIMECDLDYTETDAASGITISLDASLDGDNLTFKETFTVSGSSDICDVTATRQ